MIYGMTDDEIVAAMEELAATNEGLEAKLASSEATLLECEARLRKAVEGLEFYADERNYEGEYISDECGCCGSWYEPIIHKDGQDSGDKARATLAEINSHNKGEP
jgi:hypothetical protein